MAEFNRTSLDIMDEIYAPFKAAQAQKHGLERQAGGASLARQLQLTDAYTKRQQQLTDATTKRQHQVDDATTAHIRGKEDITHLVDEQTRAAEEAAQKRRDENLKDKRAEAGAVRDRLAKKGINLPFTIEDINSASTGQMSSYMRELNLEEEIDNANKKSHAEVLERLKAVDEEILREVMGLELDHLINWDAEGQKSKSELAEMLGEAMAKKNSRKFGKNVVPQYKHLLKQQMELLEDTGILDIITTNPPGSDEAAKVIAQDEMFIMDLNKVLTNSKWWPGDPRSRKAEEILGLLSQGDLKTASERLDGEGQAGNQPLIDAFTRWSAKSQSAIAAKVQDRILRMQGGAERLRAVGQQLNGLVDRHPWLEETVDILDLYTDNEYEAFQGRRQSAQLGVRSPREAATRPPASLEPGDPGLEGTTLFNPAGEITDDSGEVIPGQAGDPNLGGLMSPAAVEEEFLDPEAVAVGPDAAPPVQGQPVQGLGRFDRDGDGILSPYEKLLKADEEEGLSSGRAGMPEGGGTISATEAKGLGTKALDYLFPKHRDIGQSDTGYSRAGAGDVAIEVGERMLDAWLYASGWNLLRNTPAALGRVRALVSKPSGVGVGAFGRTAGNPTARVHGLANQPTIKDMAKALGGGAALKSFQEFIKNPANVRDAYKWVRETGWRYSHGATPKLVPKTHRLNFTPVRPPGSKPIVPPVTPETYRAGSFTYPVPTP